MRMARGKIPQIPLPKIINKTASLQIQRGYPYIPRKHIRPFGLTMPMQFPNNARIKPHIHARKLFTGPQLADGRLARPPAFFNTYV
jgi:hypothetical protein